MFPKIFVTDLDGTALDSANQPYARFSDDFSEWLDVLHDRGCRWAINSTWDANGQGQLVLGSSVKSVPLFLMAEYGMRLAHYKNGMLDYINPFTGNMEDKVAEFNLKYAYNEISTICSSFSPQIMHFYGHMFTFCPIAENADNFRNYIENKITDWDEAGVFNYSLNKQASFNLYPRFLNKGVALKEALNVSGIMPDDVVIAGDETADIAMMQPELAKFAVCPENACQEVKDHVVGMGGFVGKGVGAAGVIDSFTQLAEKERW